MAVGDPAVKSACVIEGRSKLPETILSEGKVVGASRGEERLDGLSS